MHRPHDPRIGRRGPHLRRAHRLRLSNHGCLRIERQQTPPPSKRAVFDVHPRALSYSGRLSSLRRSERASSSAAMTNSRRARESTPVTTTRRKARRAWPSEPKRQGLSRRHPNPLRIRRSSSRANHRHDRVLESKETPGLGDKIQKDAEFLQGKFRTRSTSPSTKKRSAPRRTPIETVRHGTKERIHGKSTASSGATISSKAIADIIDTGQRSP